MGSARIEGVLGRVGERWVRPSRVAWLEKLEAIYEDNAVLTDGRAPTLQCACPSSAVCWAGAEDRLQAVVPASVGDGENASIFWPWVGEEYRRGGVCFVTQNINAADGGWWSIAEEYGIADNVFEAFASGSRTPFGASSFWWRLLSTAGAVLASLDGTTPVEEARVVERAPFALERISRVQAIKCVPLGERSDPTRAMKRECPGRFAVPEIEVLQPGAIVAMGNAAFDTVQRLCEQGVDWAEGTDEASLFKRGVVPLNDRAVHVLWLCHPNARPPSKWTDGQAELVASLRARPLMSA